MCQEYKRHRKFAPAVKDTIVQRYIIGSEKTGLFCFDSWENLHKYIKLTLLNTRGQIQGLQRDTMTPLLIVTGRLKTGGKAIKKMEVKKKKGKKEGGKNKRAREGTRSLEWGVIKAIPLQINDSSPVFQART